MEIKTIIEWIILIGSCVSALGIIVAFLQKRQKKAIQNIFESDYFRKEFDRLASQIERIDNRVNKIDKKLDDESVRNCRMYLVDFLNDVENGIPKDSVQVKFAYDLFEHYSKDLHCNSYVHDKWIKVMENRKDLII